MATDYLSGTSYSFTGGADNGGGNDPEPEPGLGNLTISLNSSDAAYADGAEFSRLPASAWAEKGVEALLQPGDAGTWYYNITSDEVADLPELYVTYKFSASWQTDWVADNNGEEEFRVAPKTENGYLCHFWTNYDENFLVGKTVTLTVEVREANEGEVLATQQYTWNGSLVATLTSGKLSFDPATGSQLDSKVTLLTLTSEEALSKVEAFSASLYDRWHFDENNQPLLLCEGKDYEVSKVSDTKWYIILAPTEEYIAAANGSIAVAVTAYDLNGVKTLDTEYVMLEYSYATAAKVTELAITPVVGTTVEEIAEFTVKKADSTIEGTVNRNWNCMEKATLTGEDYSYEFGESDVVVSMTGVKMTVPEDKRPVAAGVYTLNIPAGYFFVGDDDPAENVAVAAAYGLKLVTEVEVPADVVTVTTQHFSNLTGDVNASFEDITNTAVHMGYALRNQAYSIMALAPDSNWDVVVKLNDEIIEPDDNEIGFVDEGEEFDPFAGVKQYNVNLEEDENIFEVHYLLNVPVVYDFTTGMEDIPELPKVSVSSDGEGHIIVNGLTEGDEVNVYTVSGHKVAGQVADNTKLVISHLNPTEVYVVTIAREGTPTVAVKVRL